jgi:hypothetical protein
MRSEKLLIYESYVNSSATWPINVTNHICGQHRIIASVTITFADSQQPYGRMLTEPMKCPFYKGRCWADVTGLDVKRKRATVRDPVVLLTLNISYCQRI